MHATPNVGQCFIEVRLRNAVFSEQDFEVEISVLNYRTATE